MLNTRVGSVAKIVKLEHAWRRLDGRNDDGFQVAPFRGDVILWAVRWYCRYPISYRDLEEMLAERGISVDHTTIYRWVQCYAPEMEKRLRWFWRRGFDPSWRRMKPTSRCGASGPTCTGQSTSGATRSISTCRRPAAPRQRSGSWARPCEA